MNSNRQLQLTNKIFIITIVSEIIILYFALTRVPFPPFINLFFYIYTVYTRAIAAINFFKSNNIYTYLLKYPSQ